MYILVYAYNICAINLLLSFSHHLSNTLPGIAESSSDEANLYVFITAKGNGNPLGIAFVGTLCNPDRHHRISVNRYGIVGSQKNKVLYTAEASYFVFKFNIKTILFETLTYNIAYSNMKISSDDCSRNGSQSGYES